MTSNTKNIAKNSIFLYLRTFITLIISIYTSRVVLATLGVDDFGIYNVIGGFVGMFLFINGSLSATVQRFLSFELGKKNYDALSKIFSTSRVIHLIIAVSLFIVIEIIGLWFIYNKMVIPDGRIVAAFWVLQTSLVSTFFIIIRVPYQGAVIAHEKFSFFAYLSIFESVSKLLLIIIIGYIENIDLLIVYSFGFILINMLINILYYVYCRKHIIEAKSKYLIDKMILKKMISFSSWNVMGAFSHVAKNQAIIVVVNIFCGVAVNAAQGITSQVNNAISGFVQSFSSVLNPPIVKAYSSGNKSLFFKLLYTGSKIITLLTLLLVIPIYIELNFILNIWLVEVPKYTDVFIKLFLISILITNLLATLSVGIEASGKIKQYQIIMSIFNVLVLPFSYLFLYLNYSPTIVYFLYVIFSIFSFFSKLYISKKILSIHLKEVVYKILLPILLLILLISFPMYVINNFFVESYLRLFTTFLISTFLLAIFSFLLIFDTQEKELIKSFIVGLRNR